MRPLERGPAACVTASPGTGEGGILNITILWTASSVANPLPAPRRRKRVPVAGGGCLYLEAPLDVAQASGNGLPAQGAGAQRARRTCCGVPENKGRSAPSGKSSPCRLPCFTGWPNSTFAGNRGSPSRTLFSIEPSTGVNKRQKLSRLPGARPFGARVPGVRPRLPQRLPGARVAESVLLLPLCGNRKTDATRPCP